MENRAELVVVFRSTTGVSNEDCEDMAKHLAAEGLHPVCVAEAAPGVIEPPIAVQVPYNEGIYAKRLVAAHTEGARIGTALSDLQTVYYSQSSITSEVEAIGIKNLLETNGIASVVVGDDVLPNMPFEVRVQREYSDQARSLIAEADEAHKSPPRDPVPAVQASPLNIPVGNPRKGSPWTANACGWIAVFFGPIAGGLISFVNLRRLKKPGSALAVLFLGPLVVVLILGVIVAINDAFLHWGSLPKFAGFAVSRVVFSAWQEDHFNTWKRTHPENKPRRWWTALPLALLGLILTVVLFIILAGAFDE